MAKPAPPNPAAAAQAKLKTFACPDCGGTLEVSALGLTVSVFCKHCGAEIDAVNENYQVLDRQQKASRITPTIPIGTTGNLFNIPWKVIGFMRRTDLTGAWFWNEYLLFNPKAGFRWLNEMNGHWVCYTTTRKPVTKSSAGLGSRQTAIYDNKTYYLFDRGYAKVKYVLGEFYWRVRQGEQTETEDYIRPPLCISKETVSQNNQQEVTWSEGKYIPAETIQDAFKLKQLPEQEGVAPAQPNLPKGYAIEFTFYSLVLTVLLFAIHGLFSFTQKDRLLLTDTYTTADYKHTKVSQPFQVTQEKAALKFSMSANVSQSWAELDIELVNDTTGEMRTLEEGVEFWSGTDSDGYWSEGSSYNDKYIGPVAPGTYHLNVDYDFQNAQNQPPILTQLSVHEGAPHSTMLWFAIIALWIFPVGCMLWAYSVETRRWVNSDYSPYQSD